MAFLPYKYAKQGVSYACRPTKSLNLKRKQIALETKVLRHQKIGPLQAALSAQVFHELVGFIGKEDRRQMTRLEDLDIEMGTKFNSTYEERGESSTMLTRAPASCVSLCPATSAQEIRWLLRLSSD